MIDFTAAYSPFFQAVFAAKSLPIKSFADLAGKSVGRHPRRHRRPGTDQGRAGQLWTSSASRTTTPRCRPSVAGQVQLIATGASVAGNMMAKNPQLGTEYKLLLKDSPNFIGVGKGEDKLRLKVNEIIADAKKSRRHRQDGEQVAGPPRWRPSELTPRRAVMAHTDAPSAPRLSRGRSQWTGVAGSTAARRALPVPSSLDSTD